MFVEADPYLADVPCSAVGLDLQSRPIEYKDFQSAGQQCTDCFFLKENYLCWKKVVSLQFTWV